MQKKLLLLTAVVLASVLLFAGSIIQPSGFWIVNGMAQPILRCTDAQSLDYSNEGSDILRFVVYVETDYDTDLDGKPDLIKTLVQLPRPAAEGVFRVPAIYEARPYIAGMYAYQPSLPGVGVSDFQESVMTAAPAKRTAAGTMSTLELAAQADPADWYYTLDSDPFSQQYLGNLSAYDYFLVRGFAVVQTAGLGTWGSEGVECCSSELETQAFKCVVEWLTGARSAYTDRTHNIRVNADWCSGKVGMTGRSYAGAMAFQVASTGVEGLETVVPVAGVASWYDYANSQGIPSGLLARYDSIADLATLCASRFAGETDPALLERYESYLAMLRDQQIALEGDFGPFWEARDYSARSGFRASALIVQGLNDETVRPKQFDLMRSAFLASGCEVKCLLHRNGHVTPANEQTGTDIMIGEHCFTEWLNLWFTHTLLGVDNEAAQMPSILVQSNVDGSFTGLEAWNNGCKQHMVPTLDGESTVSAEGAHMCNYNLLNESFDGSSGPDRLLWSKKITEEITINGPVLVHLRVKTRDVENKALMLGAVLVDQADEPFACFDTGAIGVLEQRLVRENGLDRGEGAEPYDLVEWVQTEKNRCIVSYGSLDLHDPGSGYLPASAVRAAEPIRANEWYDYTLYLQPTCYTLPAGHRLELYIVPFCGFSDDSALYDSNSPGQLRGMGLDPKTLVPFTRDYSFTVDNSQSFAELPVVGPAPEPEPVMVLPGSSEQPSGDFTPYLMGRDTFYSDSGTFLNIHADWEAVAVSPDQVEITVTVYADHQSIQNPAQQDNVHIRLDDQYVTMGSPELKQTSNDMTSSQLGSHSFTIDLKPGETKTVTVDAVWEYGGTYGSMEGGNYHRVQIDSIECGGGIRLSR
ncbi:MAG: hypothetical protein IKH34_06965 [Oscillospiraceae bacterium]|nr:hypothetical protein [Oscillospiraceae bacterium]